MLEQILYWLGVIRRPRESGDPGQMTEILDSRLRENDEGGRGPDVQQTDPETALASYARPHRTLLARRAPSTKESNLAQQIDGWPTRVPRPQSVPARTFSRPTRRA